MSLKPPSFYQIPEETARVAQAVVPEGHLYLHVADTLGMIFQDNDFVPLYSEEGQPALSPGRLALVTVLQFAEGLSDRQAAHAVRTRIDWKYLLCLELSDPGFDYSVLSEFRGRLLKGEAEQLLLDKLLKACQAQGWLKARGQQRTDSTHVLGAIRALNRLEGVGETMRHALNSLAVAHPAWLQAHADPAWVDRYGARIEDYRLPESKAKRVAYAQLIGLDGLALLTAIDDAQSPSWLRELPALQTLRQVWIQNYSWVEGQLTWRQQDNIPPAHLFINSPYDPEARYSKKRSTSWVGYKVHLTETCEVDQPHLITHIETTIATRSDAEAIEPIHQALQEKALLPQQHLADMGYVEAKLLVESEQTYQVELYGPARDDYHWQAQAGQGFAVADFQIDWEKRRAICPMGHSSHSWSPAVDRKDYPVIKIKFSKRDCGSCASQTLCTTASPPRRAITIRPEAEYKALQAARAREKTETFSQTHAQRAGVEGTLSQGIRAFGLRRARYLGLAKTHLQHLLTAVSMNFIRIGNWLAGELRAPTRRAAFVRVLKPLI